VLVAMMFRRQQCDSADLGTKPSEVQILSRRQLPLGKFGTAAAAFCSFPALNATSYSSACGSRSSIVKEIPN
jgi:hypothetical protein